MKSLDQLLQDKQEVPGIAVDIALVHRRQHGKCFSDGFVISSVFLAFNFPSDSYPHLYNFNPLVNLIQKVPSSFLFILFVSLIIFLVAADLKIHL